MISVYAIQVISMKLVLVPCLMTDAAVFTCYFSSSTKTTENKHRQFLSVTNHFYAVLPGSYRIR